ncbi:copper resistance protein CopD [Mycobacterium adipatum]|uniref:Copper resistance protein CopD n=1 Tax=Mycobacterium adipatum TaxID=1682113 RepID=A0A172UHN0_9MYCO|nr:cytochrome c oxidase assembly protein [Mycobacterium adipatum]ANE78465.1 copper resistance protein CopD [Mycobacterium adipatum]
MRTTGGRRRVVAVTLVTVAIVAAVTAAALGAWSLGAVLTATGLPDSGPLTTLGLPAVRALGETAAVIAIGGFLFAAFLVPAQPNGVLDASGYRAIRLGAVACGIWAICAALMVALSVSDVSGRPVTDLTPAQIWSAAALVETTNAWRWTAAVAATVAVLATTVLRWKWAPVLLGAALLTLVPVGLSGHASSGGAHDMATNSLLIHLGAGALWMGGLLAVLAYGIRGGEHLALAARRFSSVALWCFIAMAVSGVINAGIRMGFSDFGSRYGLLVAAKLTALAVLGVLGWRQRRSGVRALQSDPTARGPLVRLALSEAAVFGVAVGVAVGLGRTPPPQVAQSEPGPTEAVIGFVPAGSPNVFRLLTEWRFDLFFGTAAVVMAAVYLIAVWRLRRGGRRWLRWRTGSWISGCATLLLATSSGLGTYMPAMFSVHMIVVVLLSTIVPILLVVGAPERLALLALPRAAPGAPPGRREWLVGAARSSLARMLLRPVVASSMYGAGIATLLIGGLFDVAVRGHATHLLMNAFVLGSGWLFFESVSGQRNRSRQTSVVSTWVPVFGALAAYLCAGVLTARRGDVIAHDFYRSLQLPWPVDLLADQRQGGYTVIAAAAITAAVLSAVAGRRASRSASHPALQ